MLEAVLTGVAVGAAVAFLAIGAYLGRRAERSRRGGTVDLVGVSPHPEKNATSGLRITQHLDASALQRCNPSRGLHYHGAGDYCECGARPSGEYAMPDVRRALLDERLGLMLADAPPAHAGDWAHSQYDRVVELVALIRGEVRDAAS